MTAHTHTEFDLPDVRFGLMIDEMTNFSTFPKALFTLTRALLGEWVYLLRDLEVQA